MHASLDSDGNRLPLFALAANGCWVWTRTLNNGAYGRWMERGKDYNRLAHRVIWEEFNGPVPSGLELDHRCNVKVCVNPAHLKAVTHRENSLRSDNIGGVNARKTECPKGHPYVRTRYVNGNPMRNCAPCRFLQGKHKYRESKHGE